MENENQYVGASIALAGLMTMLICKFIPGFMRGDLPVDTVVAILTFAVMFLLNLVIIALFDK